MTDLPAYVWALVLAGALAIPAATSVALYRGALAAGLGRRTGTTVAVTAGAAWGAWILLITLLARADAFKQDPTTLQPWLPLAFVVALVAPLLATRIPLVARILAAPGTPARLAWPQALRVVGVVFVLVTLLDRLPAVFALPAGLGDVAVGLAAPLVARRLARSAGDEGARVRARWFNVLGLVDLVVALSLGFLAGLGPARVLMVTPSTEAVTLLPLVLVPLTAVPLAAALHVVSLRALGRTGVVRQRLLAGVE